MSLDKLDLMLIKELENDARQSVPVLAKKLGMKRTTVRYRLNRMLSERLLTISCIGDPELLGYQFMVVVGINASPGKTHTVANRLETLPAVRLVSLSVGRYNIMAWALFRDRLALAQFVSGQLVDTLDVSSFEMMLSYQWVKSYWKYFKSQTKNIHKSDGYNPSDLDLAIVRAMQADPRQTIAKIAEAVDCTRSVAKRRLDRLLKEGVLKFACIVTPTPMGWDGIAVAVLIESQPDKIYTIADELSIQKPARLLSLITGRWHIFFGAMFEDGKHMHDFLSKKLSKMDGIVKYEIIHLTDILKYDIISIGWAE